MLIILIKQTSRSNNKTTQHNNTGYVFLFDFSWGYILYIKYQLFYLSKCWSMCYSLFCCWRCGKYRGKSVDCILHRTLCLAIVFFCKLICFETIRNSYSYWTRNHFRTASHNDPNVFGHFSARPRYKTAPGPKFFL